MLAKAGLRPKKRFGQNFLVNASIAGRIARLALDGAPPRLRTLEIGAGTGALTRALVDEGAQLTAIEIDPELVAILRSREDVAAAQIVLADALAFDYRTWSKGDPWRVAGNLPYNIATPLTLRLIELPSGPDSLTVMVQKDVAERFVASPGTSAYGSLSIAVAYAMEAEVLFRSDRSHFFRRPKCTPASFDWCAGPSRPSPYATSTFFGRSCGARSRTGARRSSTVSRSPSTSDRAATARALSLCRSSSELRGERLDLGDFARLADALAEG